MTDTQDTVTQDLPTPGAGARMGHMAVNSIARSLTNQRKHFDADKLQELADSIKATGVLQPILIRPLPVERVKEEMSWARAEKREPAQYELVCGERRWRASQLAGVTEIPAVIRPLTDAQALKAQVIENLQRDDITELEEAEGYEKLMQSQNINADQLGAEVGKSRSYIYARLKLLDLCAQAREALRAGKIDYSKGLLIARIPDEGLQLKALQYCAQTNYNGDSVGYRSCAQHVQDNYMLKLSGAPFKITDALLIPSAGSCRECPKRTGANPDLFQDVSSADVCTDPKCYHAKEDAHSAAVKKAALERGQHIIEGREAKALMASSWTTEVKGYLRLDDKNDSPTGKPLRKLIGKAMEDQGIQATLVANPHKDGELIAVITPDQAEVLLKSVKNEDAAAKIKAESDEDIATAKRKAEAEALHAYEEQWRWNVLLEAWKQISGGTHDVPADAVLRHIARNIARGYNQDRAKKLCKLLDLGKVAPVAGLLQYINDTDAPGDALQLLVMFGDVEYRSWLDQSTANAGLRLVAEDYGVDIEAVKARTKANQRAAQAAKKTAEDAKNAAPKADLPQSPAARAGGVDARGKAKKGKAPAAPAGELPKTSTAHASAQIAEALQGLQESGAAAAAQGNDGAPVADAQAPTTGAKARDNKADPVAAKAAQGLPPSSKIEDDYKHPDDAAEQPAAAQAAAADDGQGSTDVKTGATAKQWTPEELLGEQVRILPSATGKKQKPWIDYDGTVIAILGPEAIDVSIRRAPRCAPIRVGFHTSEVEVIE